MNKIKFFLLAFFMFFVQTAQGGYTIRDFRFVDVDELATLPVEKHYRYGCEAYHFRDWKKAAHHFNIVSVNFPHTNEGIESKFYLGVSQFYLGEYEFANQAFTDYLKCTNNPDHLEDAIKFKFYVAEAFRSGAKRRIMGWKYFPAWLDASEEAIETYDEIISAFPCHPLALDSLFAKGNLLWSMEDYRGAVDAFMTLIRRFPKEEKAPESYLMVSRVYLDQAAKEFQNPDILALADLNLKKFDHDFPTDERLDEAKHYVQLVKEVFAKGLYTTGRFYERIKKPSASILYYQNAIERFPDTDIASRCRNRLSKIGVDIAVDDEISN